MVPTPVESIEEFKVATSGQTADFNGSAGSQVQMVTKRGTKQLHGSLYEYYYGSDVGAANTWNNNHTPSQLGLPYTPLPASSPQPLWRSRGRTGVPNFLGGKWYLFGNYEGYRFPQRTTLREVSAHGPDARGSHPASEQRGDLRTVQSQSQSGDCERRHLSAGNVRAEQHSLRSAWDRSEPDRFPDLVEVNAVAERPAVGSR